MSANDPPFIPHADCGDKDCCGCIMPVECGMVDLTCNECGARTTCIASERGPLKDDWRNAQCALLPAPELALENAQSFTTWTGSLTRFRPVLTLASVNSGVCRLILSRAKVGR
jgi:hypothetical protein